MFASFDDMRDSLKDLCASAKTDEILALSLLTGHQLFVWKSDRRFWRFGVVPAEKKKRKTVSYKDLQGLRLQMNDLSTLELPKHKGMLVSRRPFGEPTHSQANKSKQKQAKAMI